MSKRTTLDPTQQEGFETKDVRVCGVKVLSEDEGIVEAFVAGIGNLDDGGDIIDPGFFAYGLKQRTPKGVWSHKWDQPIAKTLDAMEVKSGDNMLTGTKLAAEGAGGFYVKMQFNLETQRGKEAFSDVKFYGDEQEWSIGYRATKTSRDEKGNRHLIEGVTFEYSPVIVGMNGATSTISSKDAAAGVEEKIYVQLQGSMERRIEAVSLAVSAWSAETIPVDENGRETGWAYAEATYDATVVVCVTNWTADTPEDRRYYLQFPYAVTDGAVELGDPTRVMVEARITLANAPTGLAAARAGQVKEGRRNSTSDSSMLQDLHDLSVKLGAACETEKGGAPVETTDDDEDLEVEEIKTSLSAEELSELEKLVATLH